MADLPIQDIDMDQVMAMAAAQQRKVDAWCKEQGIESTSDLAFIFTSYEEALREAGRAVADAWSAARVSVQSGLAVPARQVVREASAVSPLSGLEAWSFNWCGEAFLLYGKGGEV